MPKRKCLDCNLLITTGSRCILHKAATQRNKDANPQRRERKKQLYNQDHKKTREQWLNLLVAGLPVTCHICSMRIEGLSFDLDHSAIAIYGISLPAHQTCNRSRNTKP